MSSASANSSNKKIEIVFGGFITDGIQLNMPPKYAGSKKMEKEFIEKNIGGNYVVKTIKTKDGKEIKARVDVKNRKKWTNFKMVSSTITNKENNSLSASTTSKRINSEKKSAPVK